TGMHLVGLEDPEAACTTCHRGQLEGTSLIPSCWRCHGSLWDDPPDYPTDHRIIKGQNPPVVHGVGLEDPTTECVTCHGPDLTGTELVPSCFSCHGAVWADGGTPPTHTRLMTRGSVSALHAEGLGNPARNCTACHGSDLTGANLVPSCWSCHGSIWDAGPDFPPDHVVLKGSPVAVHGSGLMEPTVNCGSCHGNDLTGTELIPSCYSCHGQVWAGGGPPPNHTRIFSQGSVTGQHAEGLYQPEGDCTACHGAGLNGANLVPACWSCHGSLWDPAPDEPPDHTLLKGFPSVTHRPDISDPPANWSGCHGSDLTGTALIPSCFECHGSIWAGGDPPPSHTVTLTNNEVSGQHASGLIDPEQNCTTCHQADLMGRYQVPACYSCHGQLWAGGLPPPTHTELSTVGSISGLHAPNRSDPEGFCAGCHKPDLFGSSLIPACWSCHGSIWDGAPDYPPTHTVEKGWGQVVFHHDPRLMGPVGVCDECHGADLQGAPLIPSCFTCHGIRWP
ncbi:MAG: hypothetical protein ACE5GE_08345, partial [Phycisphaerae bacterium]